MSFVTVGSAGDAPTFFEMVAAEKLMPSLKAAVIYAISVYGQRRPHLLRLLDSEDELFFLITVFLERHALLHSNSSFAEGLYSLRRVPMIPGKGSSNSSKPSELSPSQRRNSIIMISLIPFLKGKLDALYVSNIQQVQRAPLMAMTESNSTAHPPPPNASSSPSSGDVTRLRLRLRQYTLNAFQRIYPWVNAAYEGSRFFYQLFYLLNRTPYFSPELHILGLTVARTSASDMAAEAQQRETSRRERLRRARDTTPGLGGAPIRLLREGWIRVTAAAVDNTRNALILAVFAFKLLEWWYTSAEQKLGGLKALPPPPPPPALPVSPDGIPLPDSLSACPLCKRNRTNPAMIATSGHVFCYPCAYRFVEDKGYCPITLVPARVKHIRRLYQGT